MEQWSMSVGVIESGRKWMETGIKKGVRYIWRAQYEVLKNWNSTHPDLVITIVATVVPPEGDSRFDSWYSDTHIPDLLKFKELQGATRCRFYNRLSDEISSQYELKEYPKYLTFYYFVDRSVSATLLEIIEKSPPEGLTSGDVKRIYDTERKYQRELNGMLEGRFIIKEGNYYRNSLKGRIYARIARLTKSLLKLGPGG